MMYQFHQTRRTAARRGSVYLAVLGVAMIVSIIGMVSMQIARLELKSTVNRQAMEEARLLSHSGVEFGMSNMNSLTDWRADRGNATEMTPAINVSNGTMTYALVDEDGDLNDDQADQVRILGIGRVGEAVYVTSVLLEPASNGMTSLKTSLHSGGNLVRGTSGNITTSKTASSNGSIDNATGNGGIDGNAWAVGTINGAVTGKKEASQSPSKEMPDPTTVFNYYVANGTAISLSDIPSQTIEKRLISPMNNPYGPGLDPQGIYVIDCLGSDLSIRNVRIHGTLVLLNAGPGTDIDQTIHWEPAVENYPALLVQGSVEMKWLGGDPLQESKDDVNFNPPGTPYGGISDSDTEDEYPGLIKGLVYISGDLAITKPSKLEGALVVGGVTTVDDALKMKYDAALYYNPPPGFTSGTVMRIVPSTWTRVPY